MKREQCDSIPTQAHARQSLADPLDIHAIASISCELTLHRLRYSVIIRGPSPRRALPVMSGSMDEGPVTRRQNWTMILRADYLAIYLGRYVIY